MYRTMLGIGRRMIVRDSVSSPWGIATKSLPPLGSRGYCTAESEDDVKTRPLSDYSFLEILGTCALGSAIGLSIVAFLHRNDAKEIAKHKEDLKARYPIPRFK